MALISFRAMVFNRFMPLYVLVLVAVCSSVWTADQRPNILLILADDLGYSDLGCYGGEIETPNIDALAKGGVRFTNCYNSARCCPTRASLNTGLYPHVAGIASMTGDDSKRKGPAYTGRLLPTTMTLAEMLKDAGYITYMVGKWHMGKPGPIGRGFEEFYGFANGHSQDQWDPSKYLRLPAERNIEFPIKDDFYATDMFNGYAIEFIKQAQARAQKKAAPWFLYLAHSAPHFPIQAPKESIDKYEQRYLAGWDVLREQRFAKQKSLGVVNNTCELSPRSLVPVDGDAITNGYSGQQNPAWDSLPEDRRRDLARRMATFAAMVDHVDQGIGGIVAHLKATHELDNTLIVFLSDNGACYEWGPFGFDGVSRKGITKLHVGEQLAEIGQPHTHESYGSAWANLGSTPFRMYKHFTHEGGILNPCIVHWPSGIKQTDRWERSPVHVMDVMPTLCEIAQTTYPTEHHDQKLLPLSGRSMVPLLRGEAVNERAIYFEHEGARAVRKGPWKVVWSKRMPTEITWELYNLDNDPTELHDLSQAFPDRTLAMAKDWAIWAETVGVFMKP